MLAADGMSRRNKWQQADRARKKVITTQHDCTDVRMQLQPAPPPPGRFSRQRCTSSCGLLQAEVAALEDQVSALREQLEQSQLDYVNEKAQIATLARLTSGACAAERSTVSPASPALRAQGPASSQPRPTDPWQTIPTVCSEVRAG